VNATQDREAGGLEGVQARGWEIQRWEIKHWSPTPANHQVAVVNTKSFDQTQVAAQYRLGHQAYSLGDAKAALEHFQAAIETDPGCVKAHRWLGRVALELGLGSEAKRSFETVIRLQGYTAALGQCLEYAAEVSCFGLEAASQFHAGCQAQKNGQLNAASVAFGRAVAAAPNHQRAWARLGQILLELKSYDGAVIACERALVLEPHDAGSAYRLRLASKHTVSRAVFPQVIPSVSLEDKFNSSDHVLKPSVRWRR
jgi:cytochrome c-type biogenesis protein CcmH/NrfG